MSSSNLIRSSGLVAMIGGALWSARAFSGGYEASPWPTDGTESLFFVVQLLFLTGLVGLYVRCREHLGSEEKIAFATSFAGVAATVVGQVGMLLTAGAWFIFVLGFAVGFIGWMALGVAAIQSRMLPRWNALPLIIGSLGVFSFPADIPPSSSLEGYLSLTLWMLFGFSWALLGYDLFSFSEGRKDFNKRFQPTSRTQNVLARGE